LCNDRASIKGKAGKSGAGFAGAIEVDFLGGPSEESPKRGGKKRVPARSMVKNEEGTDEDAKKLAILIAEQKRRGVMQSGFAELEDVVPHPHDKKYSKAELLNRGMAPSLLLDFGSLLLHEGQLSEF